MAVTYSNAVKAARLTAVVAQIDAGAGPGTLEICSAAYATVLAVLPLADPCGTATGDTLTFDFDPDISDLSADATGTAAIARIKDSNGTVCVSDLSVGTVGTNIVLGSVDITVGQAVTLTTGVITHAA